jgi:ZIP family zinc transporter
MWASFAWGTLAASTLVIGAVLAMVFHISLRWIGMIMAFGAGVLISAVAFDLVAEAAKTAPSDWPIYVGIFVGCGVFFGGDWLIDCSGGGKRKDPAGAQKDGSALAIVLGSVLDGIPESMVIGLTIFQGGKVGAAYLAAVFISNLPESISSTSGLITGGWKTARILWMWIGITLISGVASLAGYGLFQHASPNIVALVDTFAAGAILTMLADSMMPEAYEHGGELVGVVTTLGFATALLIHTLD